MAARNKAMNRLPQFIWGEAVSVGGFEQGEFLTHCRYPRFVCRVVEMVAIDNRLRLGQDTESYIGTDPGVCYINQTVGLVFNDFAFIDPPPEHGVLQNACDNAVTNWLLRDDEYGLTED